MSKLIINANRPLGKISRFIYGHFSEHLGRCVYNGLYAGEGSAIPNVNGIRSDVTDALRKIKIPALRWPGGCFADEYHWKDGIGEKSKRKKMINTHWGGVTEDNSFGTHEFMELCSQLGCEPYVNGNLGSGGVAEMSEWVEYISCSGGSPMAELRAENGRSEAWGLKFFGVGNENWGCGGNMTAERYADEYRRYQTYLRDYGANRLYKVACGANGGDYRWTKVMMEKCAPMMDGLSLHYYTVCGDWQNKGGAVNFNEEEYYRTLKKALFIGELIENHSRIMDFYDPERRIGLLVDEWGTWHDVEPGTNPGFLYQQNTMRDALAAAVTLNIFNGHCGRISMANLAQTVNVLQAVILTEGEKMLLTPTYHVFDLFKRHQDATLLESYVETKLIGGVNPVPNLHVSASKGETGSICITLANLSCSEDSLVDAHIAGPAIKKITARHICEKPRSHNSFINPNAVRIKDNAGVKITRDGFSFTAPACSVFEIVIN